MKRSFNSISLIYEDEMARKYLYQEKRLVETVLNKYKNLLSASSNYQPLHSGKELKERRLMEKAILLESF